MQPSEQPQHPIDYLDSISSVPKGPAQKSNDKLFFSVIIAGVLIILAVGIFAFLNNGPSSRDDLSRLSIRLKNLQAITDSSQKNIISSKLRATNTSVSLALTNANRDITEPLTKTGLDPEKLSSKITDEESTDELKDRLEDARLNAIFDRTYAREMTYQLDTLLALINKLEVKAKNSSVKEFLSTTKGNLEPLQKQFSNFDASTS